MVIPDFNTAKTQLASLKILLVLFNEIIKPSLTKDLGTAKIKSSTELQALTQLRNFYVYNWLKLA